MHYDFKKERIKELRENLGLTQTEFARKGGFSRQRVIHWEDGTAAPQVKTIVNICNTFDVDPSYFFARMLVSELTKEA